VPPFWWNDRLAPTTLIYAGVLTVVTAVIVGVVPVLKATGPRLQARLKHAAAGGSGTDFGGLWTGVIVAQVALTVTFLLVVVSVGWNVHVGRYGTIEVRFAAREYLSARLELDRELPAGAATGRAEAAFRARIGTTYQELEWRLAAEPGVVGTTYGSRLPGTDHPGIAVEVDGVTAPREPDGVYWVRTASVAANFFDAFTAPVLAGRTFEPADLESGREVAIVDETFVRKILGGRDAIGVRVRQAGIDRAAGLDRASRSPWYEIVGAVRDLATGGDKATGDAVLYRPAAPGGAYPIQMAVRVRGDAKALAPRIRAIAAAVDPTLRLDAPSCR
jgi:hypothetical protein